MQTLRSVPGKYYKRLGKRFLNFSKGKIRENLGRTTFSKKKKRKNKRSLLSKSSKEHPELGQSKCMICSCVFTYTYIYIQVDDIPGNSSIHRFLGPFVASSFLRAHIGKLGRAWKIGGSFLPRIVPLLDHPKHFRPTTFIAINNVTSTPQGTNLPTFHN